MDNAIPFEVEEEQTVPERRVTNAGLVFGDEEAACDGCSEGVPHYCGVRWVDDGFVARLPVAR